MRKWTVRAAQTVLVAAAITAAGAGVANADHTRGDRAVAGGNQTYAPIFAPVSAESIAAGILGQAFAFPKIAHGGYNDNDTEGMAIITGQNPAVAPASGGINVCGNAMSSGDGVGTAACVGRATVAKDDNTPLAQLPAAPVLAAPEAAPVTAPVAAPVMAAPPVAAPEPSDVMANGPVGAPTSGEQIGAPGSPTGAIAPQAEPPASTSAPTKAAPPVQAPITSAPPVQAPVTSAAPDNAPIVAPDNAPVAAPENTPAETQAAPSGPVGEQAAAPAPARGSINVCGNAGANGGVATAACEGMATGRKLSGNA
jgi:hypothetical protein